MLITAATILAHCSELSTAVALSLAEKGTLMLALCTRGAEENTGWV